MNSLIEIPIAAETEWLRSVATCSPHTVDSGQATTVVLIDEPLTSVVIGGFHTVFNKLGYGFLENVYVGALHQELVNRGLKVGREVPIAVYYNDTVVGTYRVDLMVENRLVLEIKAGQPTTQHQRQLLNYLRCTDVELGLLLCFGPRPVVRRFIYRNALKNRRP